MTLFVVQPVFLWLQEKVVNGRSSCLSCRNHIIGREIAVAFISESCHPVIPSQLQKFRQVLEDAMRIDYSRACVQVVQVP
jgi:hypothetical protein